MNLTSDFRNSKWRTQYAGIIFWKANDFHITLYSKVLEVADYEFDIGFSELKMADPIWWT